MSWFHIEPAGEDQFVRIDRQQPIYSRGAAILAALAVPPERAQDPRTLYAWRVLCRLALAAVDDNSPDWTRTHQPLLPWHLTLPLEEASKAEPDIRRRLETRSGAAHAAAPFLQDAERQRDGVSQGKRGPPGVQASAMRTIGLEADRVDTLRGMGIEAGRRFPEGPDNFETRVLRESLPVVHLAFAVQQAIGRSQHLLAAQLVDVQQTFKADVNRAEGRATPQFGIGEFIFLPEVQDFVVEQAERLEGLLPLMRRLRPKRVVRLRQA